MTYPYITKKLLFYVCDIVIEIEETGVYFDKIQFYKITRHQ